MFLYAFEVPINRPGKFRVSLYLWLIIWLLGSVFAGQTAAHDGYEQYHNPKTGVSCCNDRDCRHLSANEVEARIREVAAGVMVDGRLFPKDQLQEGPDGRWHVCEHPETKYLFCVLTPRPSF